MRKFQRRFLSFGVLTAVLVITAMAFAATFAFTPSESLSAQAAVVTAPASSSTRTMLGADGLQVGNNNLSATTRDFYSKTSDSSGNSTVTISNDTSAPGITTNATGKATVASQVGVKFSNSTSFSSLSSLNKVQYSLQDENIVTNFTYTCNYSANGLIDGLKITTRIYYSNSFDVENDIAKDYSKSPTDPYDETSYPDLIGEVVTEPAYNSNWTGTEVSVSIDVQRAQQNMSGTAHLYVESTIEMNTSNETAKATKITLSNPKVSVTLSTSEMAISQNPGVNLTISGANRTTTTYYDVLKSANKSELDNVYVKEGDIITITAGANLSGNNAMLLFGGQFAAALGRANKTCIDWHTYSDGKYGNSTSSYLEQIDTNLYYQGNGSNESSRLELNKYYYGYSLSFRVKANVKNADTLSIIPRFVKTYTGTSSSYWYL